MGSHAVNKLAVLVLIKSPNFSGMWAPCIEKEEIELDDPFLILHLFISLLASDLS